jgi:hypothetical protein
MEGDSRLAFRFSKFTIKMAVLRRLETGLAYPSCGAGIPRGWRDTRGFSHVPRFTAADTRKRRVPIPYICRWMFGPSINPELADYQDVKPL